MKHYFATDGTYGDAQDILVIDSDLFTNEDWLAISTEYDSDRIDLVRSIYKQRMEEQA